MIKPVGLNDAEDALFACLINPAIDSVLLYGGHGSGKTLLLERVACLTDRPVVRVPLNVTEDVLFGSLDLGAALTSGIRERRPGLLERAHGGFLLLDDAPLLGERLLTIILNVCNKKRLTLERDGLSAGIPAEFTLLATAAPEQDLDPKLLETFAFFLPLTPQTTAEERLLVLENNLKDEAPDVLKSQRDELGKAQQGLADVAADRELLRRVVDLTREAGIRLPRAAMDLLEGARALAARAGRKAVNAADLRRAARWTLAHRRRGQQQEAPPEPETPSKDSESTETETADLPEAWADLLGQILEDLQAIERLGHRLSLDFETKRVTTPLADGKRLKTRSAKRRGKIRGVRPWRQGTGGLAVVPTIKRAALRSRGRTTTSGLMVDIRPEDYLENGRVTQTGAEILFLVDASGSMGARKRMGAVKGAILALLDEAYRKRDRVGMLAFRGDSTDWILPMTRSLTLAEKRLETLPTGGETPLALGLNKARETLLQRAHRAPEGGRFLVLVSDCRANRGLGGDPLADALKEARLIQRTATECLVLDTQPRYLGFDQGRQLAEALGGRHVSLGQLTGREVHTAVRDFMNKNDRRNQ